MGARTRPIALIACGLASALAAPTAAFAQDAAAIAVVQRIARPDLCRATMDFSRAQAYATPRKLVTRQRPAGVEVTVPGHSDPNASGADFDSRWLVTSNYAYPQNVPAARLRTGCQPTTFDPKIPLDWHALDYIDPSTGRIDAWSNEAWGGARHVPAFDSTTHSNQLDSEESMAV